MSIETGLKSVFEMLLGVTNPLMTLNLKIKKDIKTTKVYYGLKRYIVVYVSYLVLLSCFSKVIALT